MKKLANYQQKETKVSKDGTESARSENNFRLVRLKLTNF